MLVDHADDIGRQNAQADGRGDREVERQPQRLLDRAPEGREVVPRVVPRDRGQRHGGDGHAEHADGKLHQPERAVEPRARAVDLGCKHAVHQHVHLYGRPRNDAGPHQDPDLAQTRIAEIETPAEAVTELAEGWQLDGELRQAAQQDPEAEAVERPLGEVRMPPVRLRVEDVRQGDAADHGDHIERARRRGWQAEDESRVEHAHDHGGQRHEQDEREQHAREPDRQLEFPFDLVEPEVGHLDDPGAGGDAEQADRAEHDQDRGEQDAGEAPGRFGALLLMSLRERGGEGRGEGAFREEVAHQVGNLEGGQKRVQALAGAEHGGEDQLPGEAQHARAHHRDTDDPGRPTSAAHGRKL